MFYENYPFIMMFLTVAGLISIACRCYVGSSDKFQRKCDKIIFIVLFLFVFFNINPLLNFIFSI